MSLLFRSLKDPGGNGALWVAELRRGWGLLPLVSARAYNPKCVFGVASDPVIYAVWKRVEGTMGFLSGVLAKLLGIQLLIGCS